VPTGGGKTLLAAAALERIQTNCFKRQTGFALWVVPSDAIYRQTWKNLANREHPYRQILERASGGRVKMLEKEDAFTKADSNRSRRTISSSGTRPPCTASCLNCE